MNYDISIRTPPNNKNTFRIFKRGGGARLILGGWDYTGDLVLWVDGSTAGTKRSP